MSTKHGASDRVAVGQLVVKLQQRYQGRLAIDFYDPKCFLWLWWVIRHQIRGGQPTWIYGTNVIFRGVPSFEQLCEFFDPLYL